MADSGHAIEVRDLRKEFPGVVAVDGLTFEVGQGEIFGLVGPDGAGKTTTLRMIAGVMAPDSGTVMVAGSDIVADPEGPKHVISYMPQRFGLYEELTVNENIRFYADLFGIKKQERLKRAPQLLEAAGLGPFGDRRAGQLSGGMKQKLGLVCALIHTPKVILLDEPTNGVDPVSRRDFWRILYELVDQGVAILTSTAYLDEAERCHRVALLHEGKLLFCDTPAELKKNLQGDVLAVVSAEPERLEQALKGAEGIISMVLVGDGMHLVVDEAQRRIEEIKSRLSEAQVTFDAIDQVTPTVEDLFVAAVEQQKRTEKAEQSDKLDKSDKSDKSETKTEK